MGEPGSGAPVVLDGVVEQVLEFVTAAGLGAAGEYAASPGGAEPDLYGSADAAAIRYILSDLPADGATRDQWLAHLRSFQDSDGAFRHTSHNAFHTTAQAVGALDLFDAQPSHRLSFLEPLLAAGGIESLLDELDLDPALDGLVDRGGKRERPAGDGDG